MPEQYVEPAPRAQALEPHPPESQRGGTTAAASAHTRAPVPKRWGVPLVRLDQLWTRIEQRLAVWVIIAEVGTLVAWVSVKGLASFYTPGGNAIGVLYRSILGAVALGV